MYTENNLGLASFELSEYKGTENLDYFAMLPILNDFLENEIPAQHWSQIQEHLTSFGYLVSGKLNILVNACHKEGKYGKLEKYDRHGNRIDEIIYSPEQIQAKEIAHSAGLVNLDYHKNWNIPFYYYHREALAYLSNLNGEAGYNCPLAMTEGMLEILKSVATKEQQKRFLPLIVNEKLDYHFACGQYLTERVGGSNIGANRTIAIKGDNGKYHLLGEKWFCSNPGEVWVTTAKIKDSDIIGAFIMGRRKQNGELNDHHLLRTKDIIGSRGKVTAEIEFRYAEAELLGKKASSGLALLIRHVINISRVHVALSAAAGARRCFWEARAYTNVRKAYGQTIACFAGIQTKLCKMQSILCALESSIFSNWTLKQNTDPAFDCLAPLLKYKATIFATDITHEAIMIHGGNGILNDYSVLPRLHNDCIINETWEGTHNIIAIHVIKAMRKKKSGEATKKLIERNILDCSTIIQKEFCAIKKIIDLKDKIFDININQLDEEDYLHYCDQLFIIYSATLLMRQAEIYLKKNKKIMADIHSYDEVNLALNNIYFLILLFWLEQSTELNPLFSNKKFPVFKNKVLRKKLIEFS